MLGRRRAVVSLLRRWRAVAVLRVGVAARRTVVAALVVVVLLSAGGGRRVGAGVVDGRWIRGRWAVLR